MIEVVYYLIILLLIIVLILARLLKRLRRTPKGEDFTEKMWEWIDRDVPLDFFDTAGKIGEDVALERWKEIPDYLKPLASMMMQVAVVNNRERITNKTATHTCFFYRQQIYFVYKQLKDHGIDLHLPHGWYCDGVMTEPEWIVRITNGIIGWECDESRKECGLTDCRFRTEDFGTMCDIYECLRCGNIREFQNLVSPSVPPLSKLPCNNCDGVAVLVEDDGEPRKEDYELVRGDGHV
jgi:hypothetical protein